jgi:hypothetical protein
MKSKEEIQREIDYLIEDISALSNESCNSKHAAIINLFLNQLADMQEYLENNFPFK